MELLRTSAVRVIRAASDAGVNEPVNDLIEASAGDSVAALEERLVRWLCTYPELRPHVRSGDVAAAPPVFRVVGSPAEAFALPVLVAEAPSVGKDTLRLSSLRGKFVFLDVSGTWCAPCREKYPAMRELAARLRGDHFEVLGLLLRDSPREAARFIAQQGALRIRSWYSTTRRRVAGVWSGHPWGSLSPPGE